MYSRADVIDDGVQTLGKGMSVVTGKSASSLICVSTQSMRRAMYWGAGRWTGFLYFTPSCHVQVFAFKSWSLVTSD